MNLIDKIAGKRIIIRPFIQADFGAFQSFMKNSDSTKYLLFEEEQKTDKGILELFDYTLKSYSKDMAMASLAIADKATNDYIGSVGFAPDFFDGNVQVYWSVNQEYEGKGYATEAMRLLLPYIRSQFTGKIKAYCHPDNKSSEKVALKSSMIDGGIMYIEAIGQNSRVFEYQF